MIETKNVRLLAILALSAVGCTGGSPPADPGSRASPSSKAPPTAEPVTAAATEVATPALTPVSVNATPDPVASSTPAAVSTPVAVLPTTAPYPPTDLPRMSGMGAWPSANSFEELVDSADLFITGDVINVAPAPDYGERLPYTNSTILVTNVLKGRASTGETITVSQTGGVYTPTHMIEDQKKPPAPLPSDAPPGEEPPPAVSIPPLVLLELEDDPLFRVGQRVALALAWNPTLEAYLLVTGPQARFTVDEQSRVHPVADDDPAVAPLEGISVEELAERVAAAAN